MGQHAEARTAIEEVVTLIERNGGALHLPETLRIKAEILADSPDSDPRLAEQCLLDAIGHARQEGALSWELRAATSLARLWSTQGRIDTATALLAPVHDVFSEGRATRDHVAARQLLNEADRSRADFLRLRISRRPDPSSSRSRR